MKLENTIKTALKIQRRLGNLLAKARAGHIASSLAHVG